MKDNNYPYCNFSSNTVPSFEEFYKQFLSFVKDVRIQGDQLYEIIDALTNSVNDILDK